MDIRVDIYSLGCTLYKLLTGHAPFSGHESGYQKMTAHIHEPVKPLRAQRPDVREGLDRVLERMVAKQPADRFATPGEPVEALRPFAAGCQLRRLAAQARGESVPDAPDTAFASALAETEPPRVVWSLSVARFLRNRTWRGTE